MNVNQMKHDILIALGHTQIEVENLITTLEALDQMGSGAGDLNDQIVTMSHAHQMMDAVLIRAHAVVPLTD